MPKDENPALLLASSGTNKQGFTSKKFISLDSETREVHPLYGINTDIRHFKEMFQSGTIVQSTKHKDKLKRRKNIIFEINNFFQKNKNHNTQFFFTGHGTKEGEMVIQTTENPDGQIFTIEELYDLWHDHQRSQAGVLYIYLDCCYAGKMAKRLKKNRKLDKREFIMMWCSSGPKNRSFDLQKYGGLLIARSWNREFRHQLPSFEEKKLQQLFQAANPTYLFGTFVNGWDQLKSVDWYMP